MTRNIKAGLIASALFASMVISSCKRYLDPPPYFEENTDSVKTIKRKVLIIGIDGASGAAYKKMQLPVLEAMKVHSKYSWESVSDESTTDAASWKSLLSGASFAKHQISDSSLIYSQPITGSEHDAPKSYPSFFSYILSSARPETKSSLFTSWSTLAGKLATEIDDKVTCFNDDNVKDSAVSRLKTGNSDIVIVHFNGTATAGKTYGFAETAQGYKDAALKIDSYIGELMTALKSRPEYNRNEEWLVIVTGTHGGAGNTYGGASAAEVNNFSFYYNEKLKPLEFIKAGFTSVQIKNKDIRATIPDDAGLYNPNLAPQTISVKFKSGTPSSFPHFFSKMTKFVSTGWTMFTNSSGNWCLSVDGSSERRFQGLSVPVFDNKWHTLTFKFMDSAAKRWVVRYLDGTRLKEVESPDITALGSISSTAPITMGFGADPGYNGVPAYFADCMIFNTSLSDAEVASLVCMADIKQHPKYANLIGYWPCNEGYGAGFRNNAAGTVKKDFILQGAYTWESLADLPCTTPPVPNDPTRQALLVTSLDMVPNVFYWLKIPENDSWVLDGNAWIKQFELEFEQL